MRTLEYLSNNRRQCCQLGNLDRSMFSPLRTRDHNVRQLAWAKGTRV